MDFVVEARSDERPYWQTSGVETIVRGCSFSRLAAIDPVRIEHAFGAAAVAATAGRKRAAAPSAAAALPSRGSGDEIGHRLISSGSVEDDVEGPGDEHPFSIFVVTTASASAG